MSRAQASSARDPTTNQYKQQQDPAAELELQSIMGPGGVGDSAAGAGGDASARAPLAAAAAAACAAEDSDAERGWWPAPSRPPTPTLEDRRRQRRSLVGFATVGAVLLALTLVSSLGGGGGGGGSGAAAPALRAPPSSAPRDAAPPPPSPAEEAIWSEDSVADLGGDGLTPDAAASAAGAGTTSVIPPSAEDAAARRDEADLERAVARLGDRYVPCSGSALRCDVLHPRPLPDVDFRGVPRHAVSRVAALEKGGGGGGGGRGGGGGGSSGSGSGSLGRRRTAGKRAAAPDGRGMVAADSSRCSEVGRDVLLEGGNAADAAVAVGLCQGVVSPMSCGLGGGAFILVRMSKEGAAEARAGRAAARAAAAAGGGLLEGASAGSGDASAASDDAAPLAEFIDARETAPAASSADMFAGKPPSASAEGGLGVAVPTELLGYARLYERHGSGRVPWSRLVAPAAELARAGFAAHPYLVHTLAGNRTLARVRRSKVLREAFLIREEEEEGEEGEGGERGGERGDGPGGGPGGGPASSWRPPLPGELCCRRPALARTLERIAERGARYLYEGEAAEALSAAVVAAGGVLTAKDLGGARAEVGAAPFEVDVPLPSRKKTLRLVLPPPPSSAAVVAFGLRFLAGYLAGGGNNVTAASASAAAAAGDNGDSAAALAAFAALGFDDAAADAATTASGSGSSSSSSSSSSSAGLWAHRLAEALKHGFAARTALGDGAFAGLDPGDAADIAAAASDLAGSAPYCDALRLLTRDQGVLPAAEYGGRWNPLARAGVVPPPEDHGTSHYVAVDASLSAVAVTTTVNMVFGSGVADPFTGIVLNDEMDDFSQPGRATFVTPRPARANFVAPGKRPLSAMSPIFAVDAASGALVAAAGASGGPLIVSSTLQVLARALLMPPPPPPPPPPSSSSSPAASSSSSSWPLGAVAAPRLHAQLLPSSAVLVEEFRWGRTAYAWPRDAKEGLAARGQALREVAGGLGVVQMVLVEEEEGGAGDQGGAAVVVLRGVSDPRKDGAPMGA
jgi:gamma-glutamyltranspeptidase/glutathione hydrolase/leukotriene-C4 hydrolase